MAACSTPGIDRNGSPELNADTHTTLILTALMVLVGVIVAYAQERQPPEISHTRVLQVRATPVIAFLVFASLVGALIVAGWAGKETDVQPVTDARTLPARPTMRQADARLAQVRPCTVPLDGDRDLRLRPTLLVAAEGGGLGATYRTATAVPPLAPPEQSAARRPQPVPPWGGHRRREQCTQNYDLFAGLGRDGDRTGDHCTSSEVCRRSRPGLPGTPA